MADGFKKATEKNLKNSVVSATDPHWHRAAFTG